MLDIIVSAVLITSLLDTPIASSRGSSHWVCLSTQYFFCFSADSDIQHLSDEEEVARGRIRQKNRIVFRLGAPSMLRFLLRLFNLVSTEGLLKIIDLLFSLSASLNTCELMKGKLSIPMTTRWPIKVPHTTRSVTENHPTEIAPKEMLGRSILASTAHWIYITIPVYKQAFDRVALKIEIVHGLEAVPFVCFAAAIGDHGGESMRVLEVVADTR